MKPCLNFLCPNLIEDNDVLNCIKPPYQGRYVRERTVKDCEARKRYDRRIVPLLAFWKVMQKSLGKFTMPMWLMELLDNLSKERDKYHGRK